MNNIAVILQNPHLRWCVILLVALEVAAIWLPNYKAQLDSTEKVILFYAIAAAANSAPTQKQP